MEKKVSQYLARIGLDLPEPVVPDAALLQKLQYAHCTTVPYENLDILRGHPLSLETDDLFEKVVVRRQGGFCFELNGLFAWLLRQLGYEVHEYAARYLRGESAIPMRRHRVLIAKTEKDGDWLCDVGIGEVCPRWPLRMSEGEVQEQQEERYRLEKDDFLGWVLKDLHHGAWQLFYSFTMEEQLPVDFIAPTFYCEHHPDSPFNKEEMFSLKTAQGRITLDGHLYKEIAGGQVTARQLTEEEMPEAYRKFGLTFAGS